MKFIAGILITLIICWLLLRVTNGALLTAEEQANNGLSLRCQYITASGLISIEYLNTSSTLAGKRSCAKWKEKNAYPS